MPKQSRLGDDALIYQPRKEQTEREKLREMSFKDKLSYIWEYYKLYIIGGIAGIALIIYIIYTALTPSSIPQFYAALLDNTIDPAILEEYREGFSEYLELDPKRESVELNSSFYLNSKDQFSIGMSEVLSTLLAAREIDVIIAPESTFSNYAFYGYMDNLSEQLPTDIYSDLTEYFYISDTEEDKEKNVYGIYLTEAELFKNNADNSEPYILGIIPNAKHKGNAVEFIRYLFMKN